MAGTEQVLVPDIGDFDDVPVIEVLVAVGDDGRRRGPAGRRSSPTRRRWRSPRPSAGKVTAIEVAVGDKVKEGSRDRLARGERRQRRRAEAETAPAGRRRRGRAARSPRTSRPRSRTRSRPRRARAPPAHTPGLAAGRRRARRPPTRRPAVRRLARELGVDLCASAGPAARAGSPRRTCRSRSRRDGSRSERRGAASTEVAGPGPRAVAEGQLRALRRDRAPAAHPDPEDQRPEPGPQLGDDPARHAQRRGGHHRAGGVPQAHQRRAVRGQGDDGRAAGEGRRGVAEGVPGRQLARSTATTWCSSATTTSASRPTRRTASSSR